MGTWGEFGGWGMGFGFIFMLLFWVLVVLGIAALLRWLLQQGRDREPAERPRGRSALDILRERYARGEIEREEFEQKRKDLEA